MDIKPILTSPAMVPEDLHQQGDSTGIKDIQGDIDPPVLSGSMERLREMFPQQSKNKLKTPDEAASIIVKFFRKAVAASVYHYMFSNGSCFSETGYAPANAQRGRFSKISNRINKQLLHLACMGPANMGGVKGGKIKHPESLQILDKISRANISRVRGLVGDVSPEERRLLSAVIETPWHFRHQTRGSLEKGGRAISPSGGYFHPPVVVMSGKSLLDRDPSHHSNTPKNSKTYLANDDFVFFGIEFTNVAKLSRPPLSLTHTGFFYGSSVYVTLENDSRAEYGYMTLRDHWAATTRPRHLWHEIKAWGNTNDKASGSENTDRAAVLLRRAKGLNTPISSDCDGKHSGAISTNEFHTKNIINVIGSMESSIIDYDFNDPLTKRPAMFSYKDMRLGLGLHLINFLRGCGNEDFKRFAYAHATKDSVNLHRVLNLIFQPEFHIPKIWSSMKYYSYLRWPKEPLINS